MYLAEGKNLSLAEGRNISLTTQKTLRQRNSKDIRVRNKPRHNLLILLHRVLRWVHLQTAITYSIHSQSP